MTTDSERGASERPAPDHEVIAVRRGLFGRRVPVIPPATAGSSGR